MNESKQFREDIRLLVRKLGILDKVTHKRANELSLPQCHALVEIGRSKDISLKDLAQKLDIDVSTTSRTVDGLVKKGLVTRILSETDRRYIHIRLSESGNDLFQTIEESMNCYYANVFHNIPKEKQDQVLESLTLIMDALSKESEES